MGTRNMTYVVYHGNIVINQYGRWDGNPEVAGAYLASFCKDPSWVRRFMNALDASKIVSEAQLNRYCGGTVPNVQLNAYAECGHNILNDWPAQIDYSDKKYGRVATITYFMASSDIGYHIPTAMTLLHEKYPDAILPVYLNFYRGREIQGEYYIDLDRRTFHYRWKNGQSPVIPFEELDKLVDSNGMFNAPALTPEAIQEPCGIIYS